MKDNDIYWNLKHSVEVFQSYTPEKRVKVNVGSSTNNLVLRDKSWISLRLSLESGTVEGPSDL